MCGIAGLVGAPGSDEGLLVRMLDAMQRRGPDSAGTHQWGGVRFGHRRLAIFDLSAAGAQPMVSDDGDVGVVFNGAIYNFRELRDDLAATGRRFRSETDTEVLVVGYQAWGIDELVRRSRGMFAFALWDATRQRLFLVRDRLGVKPLVYAEVPGQGMAFASTVRALRSAGVVSRVSPPAVAAFLQDGFVPEAHAIYEGATKLPPASIMEWSVADGARVRSYWTPPRPTPGGSITFEDALAETERLLLKAVERRLHADVPVASLLSAGVDSSLVCWAIATLGGDVQAFTLGTPGHATDEAALAAATARRLGVPHQVLAASDADEPEILDLSAAYAEPFACSSAFGMLRLSRAIARTPAKVFLTGDGGDDVFLGYPRHRMLYRVQEVARHTPAWLAGLWTMVRRAVPERGPLKRAVHLVDYATGGLAAFIAANPGFRDFREHRLPGPRLADQPHPDGAWSIGAARRVLHDYLEFDRGHQFVSEYLVKVDGASMHFGLEARSPFLDQELWEFAAQLPFDVRLHGGQLKAILRELARRRIGEDVAAAPKLGFTVPVEAWMAGRWQSRVRASFADSLLVADGWIQARPLEEEMRASLGQRRASRRLWYLWVLENWLKAERFGVDAYCGTGSSDRAA